MSRLGRGLFGDSSTLARWLARVTALDIGLTRDRTSSFSGVPLTPGFGYQLTLISFDAFRSQQGLFATSAAENSTRHASAAASLPLGLRISSIYQWTRGITWLLRPDGQAPIARWSREWPSATITWTVSPSRNTIGRVLTGLTAQLGLRQRHSASEQVTLGGNGRTLTRVGRAQLRAQRDRLVGERRAHLGRFLAPGERGQQRRQPVPHHARATGGLA